MIADYTIVNKYLFDPGVYTNGVTSPGGFNGLSVSFVQLRSATLLWLADWTALKGGAVPEIPDPFSVSPDWTLLEVMPEMPAVVPASDGVLPLYRVSGRYIYAHNKPSKTIYDQLNFPRLPTQPNVFSRSIPLSKLTDQLINGIGPASTGSSTSFPNVPSLGENIISS